MFNFLIKIGQYIINQYPLIIAIISGLMFSIITKNSEILIVIKKDNQRNGIERRKIANGLRRCLILEFFLFVPISIILLRITLFPLIINSLLKKNPEVSIWYALMGIVGYGFPFAAIRETIIRLSLKTLKEFESILIKFKMSS